MKEAFKTYFEKGKDLKNVEGFTNPRKSDPFYILSRLGPSTSGW